MPFTLQDISTILFLIFLEGILSIDNAVVLAMLARGLPPQLQKKALTYGLVGAVIFRLIALSLVTQLMKWVWIKFIGGAYLIVLAVKHLVFGEKGTENENRKSSSNRFWKVVFLVELTDIAFAVDSILAAVAVSNKFWIVFTGGVLGIILMRFAAQVFLALLKKFPAFEDSAYILVLVIGSKLFIEGFKLDSIDFHSSENPAFWIFWSAMAVAFLTGFRTRKRDGEVRAMEKAVTEEAKVTDDVL
jgi:YkoY family integral membrane protein